MKFTKKEKLNQRMITIENFLQDDYLEKAHQEQCLELPM